MSKGGDCIIVSLTVINLYLDEVLRASVDSDSPVQYAILIFLHHNFRESHRNIRRFNANNVGYCIL